MRLGVGPEPEGIVLISKTPSYSGFLSFWWRGSLSTVYRGVPRVCSNAEVFHLRVSEFHELLRERGVWDMFSALILMGLDHDGLHLLIRAVSQWASLISLSLLMNSAERTFLPLKQTEVIYCLDKLLHKPLCGKALLEMELVQGRHFTRNNLL